MKLKKIALVGLGILAAVVVLALLSILMLFRYKAYHDPYPDVVIDAEEIPRFESVPLPFVQQHDATMSLPFVGAAVIDMEGDGFPELIVGGGLKQPDALFAFRDGRFVDISAGCGLTKPDDDTTYGMAVIDANGDGHSDVFVTRGSGVYLYTNDGGRFQGTKLDIPLNAKTTPLSVAIGDINKDGHVDLYIAGYLKVAAIEGQNIFNKEGYGASSLLLLNNGDNTFRDITQAAGMSYVHNTFQGMFIDLDEDGNLDLVVAYDTGQVRTWRNLGSTTFENVENPTSKSYQYPMGIGAGDYDNDGRIDLLFSNVGDTVPLFVARGDLRSDQVFNGDQILLRNEGDFTFSDVSAKTLVAKYEFGWGDILHDFNLDGLQDAVFAQNYIYFPPHRFFRLPCRFLIQKPDHTFAAVEQQAGIENRRFAITPLIADFNGDGATDLIYVNLDGPAQAFLSKDRKNHFLSVVLEDTPASLGAVVTVELGDGRKRVDHFVATEGLLCDQTHVLTFGLGQESVVRRVEVKYPSGQVVTVDEPGIDCTVRVPPEVPPEEGHDPAD